MTNRLSTYAEGLDFYCIKTWTDCSHVGTPGYLRVIALRRGDTLPKAGDVLHSTPCNIMAPDQYCDICGYEEKTIVKDVVHLDESAIASMGLHQRMEEVLRGGLEKPCWDWRDVAEWQVFVPDFCEVSRELIEYFASHPEALEVLHWRRFEELIAAIFKNHGYETILGTGSHDQGIDLRLIQKDTIGVLVTLVQVKRYATNNPVGLEAVQALAGAVDAERANRGLLVTSSRFLPGAKAFANKLGSRLVLCEPADVAKWCQHLLKDD
jgi:hypothetical protein